MGGRAMSGYAVILAGGTGTRLWPYSRRSHPKQLLPLLGEASMLQATVARLNPLVPAEHIVVVTNAEYVTEVRRQLPDVPGAQVIGEPAALGTAAAVGLGAAVVGARDPSATMFVLPADHVIVPPARFRSDLERAAATAARGQLVTFGIPPTGPETGYGYVELGAAITDSPGAFEVEQFVEKPDRKTAAQYVAGGRHLWNSGMFAWTVETITAAFDAHLPKLGALVREIRDAARSTGDAGGAAFTEQLETVWARITDHTTIDYGVMEPSANVACVPATFQWNDVGSWAALTDTLDRDDDGNAVVGRLVSHDTTGSLIYGRSGRLIAAIGLRDTVIVDTDDALLVCPRDRAQDVKAIVSQLKAVSDPTLE